MAGFIFAAHSSPIIDSTCNKPYVWKLERRIFVELSQFFEIQRYKYILGEW